MMPSETLRPMFVVSIAVGIAALFLETAAAGQSEIEPKPATVRTLVDSRRHVIDLAVSPTGGLLFVLEEKGDRVVAIETTAAPGTEGTLGAEDAASPRAVHDVFDGRSPDGPASCIACIDVSTLAVMRHAAEGHVVTTYRLRLPQRTVADAEPLQRAVLATRHMAVDASATPSAQCLCVSPGRTWIAFSGLAFTGLTDGRHAPVRAAIAGTRLGPFDARRGPTLAKGAIIEAATISPADELVLVTSSADGAAATLSMHAMLTDLTLLSIELELPQVCDACYSPDDGSLWAVGGHDDPDGPFPTGLWRLDATLVEGRQAVKPVLVATLPNARAVTASGRSLYVATGGESSRILEILPKGDDRGRSAERVR